MTPSRSDILREAAAIIASEQGYQAAAGTSGCQEFACGLDPMWPWPTLRALAALLEAKASEDE